MKLFYILMMLVLIAALLGPFFIQGPDGAPLMTVDEVIDDNTPEVMKNRDVYRWQDAEGRWHFSDDPNVATAGDAQLIQIEDKMTTLDADWVPQTSPQKSTHSAEQNLSLPELYSGEALQQAKEAAQMMEARNQAMDELVRPDN